MTRKPATTAADYTERTRDENKARELHPSDTGALDLDAFSALPQNERRRAWSLASDDDKRGLALQMLRRNNHGPDEANIALYLDVFEAKFGSDLAIPPAADILDVVKDRYDIARAYGDPDAGQLDRVRANLLRGARLSWHAGDLLIQSVNNPGAVYSVNARGCTCPNGRAGKTSCWHVALYDILLDMQEDRAADADDADQGPGPIVVTTSIDGLSLSRGDVAIDCRAPTEVAQAIETFTRRPADLGRRLAQARACHLLAA
jgi:hypothetical protein